MGCQSSKISVKPTRKKSKKVDLHTAQALEKQLELNKARLNVQIIQHRYIKRSSSGSTQPTEITPISKRTRQNRVKVSLFGAQESPIFSDGASKRHSISSSNQSMMKSIEMQDYDLTPSLKIPKINSNLCRRSNNHKHMSRRSTFVKNLPSIFSPIRLSQTLNQKKFTTKITNRQSQNQIKDGKKTRSLKLSFSEYYSRLNPMKNNKLSPISE